MLTDLGTRLLPWLDDVVLVRADDVLTVASDLVWEFHLYVRRWRLVLNV